MTNMPAEFANINLVARTKRTIGTAVVDGQRFSWAAKHSKDKSVQISAKDVISMKWCRVDEFFQLMFDTKEESNLVFQGFSENTLDVFTDFAEVNQINFEKVSLSTSGWNWGDCNVDENKVAFNINDASAFEIPLSDISQTTRQGKSEVSVELHQDDTAPRDEDRLVEMRFYVPPLGLDVAEGEESQRQELAVNTFNDNIRRRIHTGSQDESIATFSEILLISPRGRYEIEMFASYLTLHGKTFTYKILYKSVSQLFMLENPDKVILVIGLDPAVRQGGTMYPYLLLSFDPDDELELRPNLSPQVINDKYKGKLSEEMEGPVHDVIGRVFRALTNRKIVISGSYRSADGSKAVRCSLKANDGYLHPLEKCFFFINKPVTFLRYDEIASLEFARVDAKSKTFDLVVQRQQPGSLVFTQLNRDEYGPLLEFLKSKNLHIVNIAKDDDKPDGVDTRISLSGRKIRGVVNAEKEEAAEDEDEDEDESFEAGSEEDVSDEYSSRSRASGDPSGSEDEDVEAGEDDEEESENDDESEEAVPKSKTSKNKHSSSGDASRPKKKRKEASSKQEAPSSDGHSSDGSD